MSTYVNRNFVCASSEFKDASEKPFQQIPYERVLATRDEVHKKLHKFLIDLKIEASLQDFVLGNTKKESRVKQKADTDYGGNPLYVLDHERGKVIGDSPMQMLRTETLMMNPDSTIMRKHGATLVSMNNQFSNPKKDTFYRCINCKIAFPVGQKGEVHIVEVQAVAKQIEAVYGDTHKYLDIIREVSNGARGREMTKEEKRIQAYAFAGCRYVNGIASRENGYDELLSPSIRTKYEVNSITQNNMETQIMALRELLEQRGIAQGALDGSIVRLER